MAQGTRRRVSVDLSAEPESIPDRARANIFNVGILSGGANVIMQLAHRPVGRGVAESRVSSGRVDRHPLKRLRTTSAYLAVALLGSTEDRLGLRRAVDRAHAQVYSLDDDPVAYDAFDPELQLWVAACLYKGLEDVLVTVHGGPVPDHVVEELYVHSRRLATTLQVPPDAWPADRDSFETYWQAGVARIEMDDVTRAYLRGIAELAFVTAPLGPLGRPLAAALAPLGRFMTLGWLPAEFQSELGLRLTPMQQQLHRSLFHAIGQIELLMPVAVRTAPFSLLLADTRRRLRGRGRVV